MTETLLVLVYAILFIGIISRIPFFRLEGIPRYWLYAAFILKILAAWAMVWIYTYHYPNRNEADIFKFFDDAKIVYSSIYVHPVHYFQLLTGIYIQPEVLKPYLDQMHWWYKPLYPASYNEARIMIRLNALLMLFSKGKYMVHATVFCFLALCGSISLYKLGLKLSNAVSKPFLLLILLGTPSIVFWCSGALKEGLVLFALGTLFYQSWLISLSAESEGFEPSVENSSEKLKHWMLLIIVIAILLLSKAFFIACLLPGLIALLIQVKARNKNTLIIYGLVNAFCLLIMFNLYRLGHNFDLVYKLCFKRGEFIYLAEHNSSGSLIYHNYLDFSAWAILAEAPKALFYSLFSPLPWQVGNMLTLAASLENIVLAGIFIYVIVKNTKSKNEFADKKRTIFLLFMLNFLLYALILTGLTTPVAGSLVRYKAPLIAVIAVAVFQNGSKYKLK